MKSFASKLGSFVVIAGLFAAGSAMAEEPAAAAIQAPAPITHNDPIVQKRMEVREANREHRANRAEARKVFNKEVRGSRAERNESVQDSRARAEDAINQGN